MNIFPGIVSSAGKGYTWKTSYNTFLNGTDDNTSFALNGYTGPGNNKLSEEWWIGNTAYINSVVLYGGLIYINGIEYGNYENVPLVQKAYYDEYSYRNDGYGVGVSDYVDALNGIMSSIYGTSTRLYSRFFVKNIGISSGFLGKFYNGERFELNLTEEYSGELGYQYVNYQLKWENGIAEDSVPSSPNYPWF